MRRWSTTTTVDFKPIAVCLMSTARGELEIGVHQIIPENARSIAEFVQRNRGTLLFHVVVFTQMSYAECQSHIRRIVAARSGSRLTRGKAIQGDRAAIERAMTHLALDASEVAGDPPSSSDDDSEEEAEEGAEAEEEEDEDEETGDSDDAGFIDDECEEEDEQQDLEDSDAPDVEVTPPRSTLKRLRRLS